MRRLKIYLLIAVVGFLFFSCQTISKPSDSVETLLCMPLENIVEPGIQYFEEYFLLIHDHTTFELVKRVRIPKIGEYIIVHGLPPGYYYIAGYDLENYYGAPGGDGWYFHKAHDQFFFELREGELRIPRFVVGLELFKDRLIETVSPYCTFASPGLQRKTGDILMNEFPEEMSFWTLNLDP